MQRTFEEAARAAIAAKEASEIVRKSQQGFGKPIISGEVSGFRVVAVGKAIKASPNWRFFTDFLLDYLKDTIGRDWASRALAQGKAHPIFDWFQTLQRVSDENKAANRDVFEARQGGHLSALWRLSYGLYLIAHNDQMDTKLIKRLRNLRSFHSAYHESQVAAAFAVAGYNLKMAELVPRDRPIPEFWAAKKDGRRFGVEAKCKDGWKSNFLDRQSFESELRQWIRDQIYKCSLKRIPDAVYFLELGAVADLSRSDWDSLYKKIESWIAEASDITVKGEPAVPSYIIISNTTDQLTNEVFQNRRVVMLFGFRKEKWVPNGTEVEIEFAFDSRDLHRDIHEVLRCLEGVDEVPQSFDGSPIVFDEQGRQQAFDLKIGKRILYPDADSVEREGVVIDICSAGEKAYLIVKSDDEQHIVTAPLQPHEKAAAEKYGDAIFGKPQKKQKNLEGDFLKFYDWVLETYATYDRSALLKQVENHPQMAEYCELPEEQLLIRVAREVTKGAMATSGRRGQV